MALAALLVAIAAFIVSAVSVIYTRRQAVVGSRQAVAAEAVTAIENKRLHDDLTPVLDIACAVPPAASAYYAEMTLKLTGPPGLDRLDEVTVRIRDDRSDRKPRDGSDVTPEQFAEVIWGPYRINPGLRLTDSCGRQHGPFPLPRDEPYPIPLQQSMPPSWSGTDWRGEWEGKPVRAEVTCHREGREPWVVQHTVDVELPPDPQVVSV